MSTNATQLIRPLVLFMIAVFVLITAPATLATNERSQDMLNMIIRVPQDVGNLQDAVRQAQDGDIIEMATGTYFAPTGGFDFNQLGKSITVRSANGANVTLDGANNTRILKIQNTARDQGRPIYFDGITFANGRSTENGFAGGVTLYNAEAAFRNCAFINNQGAQPLTGGGGLAISNNSFATFEKCTWMSNTALHEGAGMDVNVNSQVMIFDSEFNNNRANIPGHKLFASGGAIHIANTSNALGPSSAKIYNTLFQDNQAYVGGAIHVIGQWKTPVTEHWAVLEVYDSKFIGNNAAQAPGSGFPEISQGGALLVEDQAYGKIVRTTFEANVANSGGGIGVYRAVVEIDESYFMANEANGQTQFNGHGAAIDIVSSDNNDSTTNYGAINRRPSQMTVRNSAFVRGTGQPGQVANGIYVAGDRARIYGEGGVSQQGSVAENRAKLAIVNSAFIDMDSVENGGAITSDLADLQLTDVLIYGSDAKQGGGLSILDQTDAKLTRVTIAKSTATQFGAGILLQGSNMELMDCMLLENDFLPGVNEGVDVSYGAAIFSGPDIGRNIPAIGFVQNCDISANVGLPIFEDDRTDGPINALQYNGNRIYSTTFGDVIFSNSLPFQRNKTVAELNDLIISHNTGASIVKSIIDNQTVRAKPDLGVLRALTDSIMPITGKTYRLAYIWSGSPATLDGNALPNNGGIEESSAISAVLKVGTRSFQVTLDKLEYGVYLPSLQR